MMYKVKRTKDIEKQYPYINKYLSPRLRKKSLIIFFPFVFVLYLDCDHGSNYSVTTRIVSSSLSTGRAPKLWLLLRLQNPISYLYLYADRELFFKKISGRGRRVQVTSRLE